VSLGARIDPPEGVADDEVCIEAPIRITIKGLGAIEADSRWRVPGGMPEG
jgi:hypothetical protein